jgi:nucleoside-diphosphate-sugar epimerase
VARGGEVPVPGTPDVDLQYLDARDLADWLLRAVDAGTTGIFNAVGPIGGTTMGALMAACVSATGSAARLRWIDPGIVLESGLTAWEELPLWLPPGPLHAGLYRGDVSAAHATGLIERPLEATVADTWRWMNGDEGREACAGITLGMKPEDEIRLLRDAGGTKPKRAG